MRLAALLRRRCTIGHFARRAVDRRPGNRPRAVRSCFFSRRDNLLVEARGTGVSMPAQISGKASARASAACQFRALIALRTAASNGATRRRTSRALPSGRGGVAGAVPVWTYVCVARAGLNHRTEALCCSPTPRLGLTRFSRSLSWRPHAHDFTLPPCAGAVRERPHEEAPAPLRAGAPAALCKRDAGASAKPSIVRHWRAVRW